ncbi:hypothetical protein B484DRAFT_444457 [Ochromonadaceae sp. CCMP2298]|nr:hypothetical protein B484DRAFT_444457 [Ochromonadaceae sp. CCMP2298]
MTTIMFPCRHLCICAECASTLAVTNAPTSAQTPTHLRKCPVCRKSVVVMLQLKS